MASNLFSVEWITYLVIYLLLGLYFSKNIEGSTSKIMSIIGWPIEITQKLSGTKYIPYLFLLPNMVIFGLFTFAPLGVNFGFSATDGMSIMFSNREFSGLDNVYRIFSDTQIDTGLENYQDDKRDLRYKDGQLFNKAPVDTDTKVAMGDNLGGYAAAIGGLGSMAIMGANAIKIE